MWGLIVSVPYHCLSFYFYFYFYWPGMKVSVTEFCRLCDSCAARKPSPKQNKAPMGNISSGAPMEKVCIDILGPLPLTRQKHKYILEKSEINYWFLRNQK